MGQTTDKHEDINPQEYLDDKDGKVYVDLTEVFDDTDGRDVQVIVEGIESFMSGTLPDKVNKLLNLPYEPGDTRFNARVGNEGFISTISEGFLKFIKSIINFITGICKWIYNGAKVLLGFEKTERQKKECVKTRLLLRDELLELFTKLGLPNDLYDIRTLLDSVPEAYNRIQTLKFIKTKLQSDEQSIEQLGKALPLLDKLTSETGKTLSRLNRARRSVGKKVSEIERKIKQNRLASIDCTELAVVINEARKEASLNDLQAPLSEVIKSFYGIEVIDGNGVINYEKLHKDIEQVTTVVNKRVEKDKVKNIQNIINNIEVYILQNHDTLRVVKEIDDELKDLRDAVNMDEATIIDGAARIVGDNNILQLYMLYTNEIKQFTLEINQVISLTKTLRLNIQSLIDWNNRVERLLVAYITEDLETIRITLGKMRTDGEIDPSVMSFNGTPLKYVINKEVGPKGVFEKAVAYLNMGIEADIFNVQKRFNNFKSQIS